MSTAIAGHVFVINARMETLQFDAAVVPTDAAFRVETHWEPVLGRRGRDLRPVSWGAGRTGRSADNRPVWFLNVGRDHNEAVEWLIDGVREALTSIADSGIRPGKGRHVPLVAMPTVGVGFGGYDQCRGEVIRHLLDVTREMAESRGIDIVIVARQRSDFAAFQGERRQSTAWARLDTDLLAQARRLGNAARAGELALFVGAGVSIPAGLPSWVELLQQVGGEASTSGTGGGSSLGLLDRAEVFRRKTDDFDGRVAELTRGDRHALGHALLAGMRCREAVTTNFDMLYERAVESAGGQAVALLPWHVPLPDQPWLLKMHGDAGRSPPRIVVSRRDFVRYDAVWRPAGSILQALLLSRHLLVVGASLNDDNVVRLIYEVSSFIEEQTHEGRTVGTVLTLWPDEDARVLWQGMLEFVPVSKAGTTASAAARELEIFLDAAAAFAVDAGEHLLDRRYRYLRGEEELAAIDQCEALVAQLLELGADRPGSTWHPLLNELRNMGA